MAATPASAARPVTALTSAVVVYADGTVAGYNHKQSANRAARGVEGARVLTRQQWADEAAAAAARDAAAKAAAEAAVVAEATEVVDTEAAKVKRDRLAPASKKLNRDQKRALASWYRQVVEDALYAAMVEDNDDPEAGAVYLPAFVEANEADIRGQVEQWLSYLPKVEAAEEV